MTHIESFTTPKGLTCTMSVRPATNDHNVCFAVLNEDEYGLQHLSLDGTVLDIGAHIGAATVAMALDNPRCHVIAIEPVPDNCRLIAANVEANGLAERVTIRQGVAGKARKIAYNFRGSESALHHANIGNQTMPAGTGYDVLRAVGIPVPEATFAKIDCEGGEWNIIPALRKIPRIHGELHPRDGRYAFDFSAELPEHLFTWFGDTRATCTFEAVAS